MKKLISLFIALSLFSVIFIIPADAKTLEQCYHCGATGEFHCPTCGNTGTVVCDGCGGVGWSVCPGEDGKGKCDNGYYTCQSCNGDGKKRTGDGKIVDGVCGNCGGSGKLECWSCHGAYHITCNRCGGTGQDECPNGNCKISRTIGWKCPQCYGTGWLGEINDGVYNVPEYDDTVRDLNGKEWRWGRENETKPDEGSAPQPGGNESQPEENEPSPPEQSDDPLSEKHVDDKNFSIVFGEENEEYPLDSSIKQQVIDIVSTSEPGRMDETESGLITAIASDNNVENLPDERIYPLYFEGHIKLERAIRITVRIEDNALKGGKDLYMYHIREDSTVELLDHADVEYQTYPSGYIETISFNTSEFSTFFTSSKMLDLEKKTDGTESTAPEESSAEPEESSADSTVDSAQGSDTATSEPVELDTYYSFPSILIVCTVFLIFAAVIIILAVIIIKKKSKKAADKAPASPDDKK